MFVNLVSRRRRRRRNIIALTNFETGKIVCVSGISNTCPNRDNQCTLLIFTLYGVWIPPKKIIIKCKPHTVIVIPHDGAPSSTRKLWLPIFHIAWHESRVWHSYIYLIIHLRRKGICHGAIYLRNWNSLHPISTNKYKFCHFRLPYLYS